MGSNNLLKLETWVDSQHAVDEDMGGHTGGCMYCGVVIIHGKASRNKLNTKITTESEVVAVSEYVTYNITLLILFWDKAMLCIKRFCIKKTEEKLIWRRTSEINAQVIQGTFTFGIYLLTIVWISRSLVSITETHRQCSPTSSLNHYKGHFFYVSGKLLWNGRMLKSCKIMYHLQRKSALKIISLVLSGPDQWNSPNWG